MRGEGESGRHRPSEPEQGYVLPTPTHRYVGRDRGQTGTWALAWGVLKAQACIGVGVSASPRSHAKTPPVLR